MAGLFDKLELGSIELPNRIVMAPLTRARAGLEAVPNDLMAAYYAQRASAGLIISEATGISREGLGWPNAPGLWNDAQVDGWKRVTDAVHHDGGRIVAQLWHMGRLVHPDLGGGQPVSSSATTAPDFAHTYQGKKPYVQARAATRDDIQRIIGDYACGRAQRDLRRVRRRPGPRRQRLSGRPIPARQLQFPRRRIWRIDRQPAALREPGAEAVGDAIGMDKVGIRFSPNIYSQGVEDSDPIPLFTALADRLEELKVPWIELREAHQPTSAGAIPTAPVSPAMRPLYSGKILLNSDYDGPSARERMAEGIADGISFGRPFISNPDLVHRIATGAPLSPGDVGDFLFGRCRGLRRLSDARRSEGRLGRVFLAKFEQGERGLGRAAALVASEPGRSGRSPALRSRP